MTGGAGFIGSHIVDALVGAGADVVVLDSLADDVHTGTPTYLNPAADLRVADLRDAAAVADAVKGADAICHQAARVGLGVDFGDVVRYVDDNDAGTATLLRALWQRDFSGRLVVASSMVVYGEGRYVCATHGIVRTQPRAEADLAAGRFEPTCVNCGGALGVDDGSRGCRARPSQRLRGHQAPHRAARAPLRARVRGTRVRPSLPQRLRPEDAE